MKQAKIMPCGKCSPCGLSAGVHRNTKVYMLPSNSDCIAPSSAIFWSAAARRTRRAAADHTYNDMQGKELLTCTSTRISCMKVAVDLIMVVGFMPGFIS